MTCTVKRIVGWDQVLNIARTTVGKNDIDKEPSDKFKKQILISEHSPIRNLLFEVIWDEIPYFVAMHLRTHHIGFHSGEDDTVFVQTQRSDRTGVNRDKLSQDSPVVLRVIMNAHSIINISRVRLCKMASKETIYAWQEFLKGLSVIEPILWELCVPNCIYRSFCPEGDKSCGFVKSQAYQEMLEDYKKFTR